VSPVASSEEPAIWPLYAQSKPRKSPPFELKDILYCHHSKKIAANEVSAKTPFLYLRPRSAEVVAKVSCAPVIGFHLRASVMDTVTSLTTHAPDQTNMVAKLPTPAQAARASVLPEIASAGQAAAYATLVKSYLIEAPLLSGHKRRDNLNTSHDIEAARELPTCTEQVNLGRLPP
jgi:hypothetical protein